MCITKLALDWSNKKYEEACEGDFNAKSGAKAFVSGVVEGFVDISVVFTAAVCAYGLYNTARQIIKK